MEYITNPDASDRAIQEVVKATLDGDDTVAGIVVLRLHKDGRVRRYTADRLEQPKEYWPEATEVLVAMLQQSFRMIQEAGERCNCPKCIQRRGGVFNGTTKAEA